MIRFLGLFLFVFLLNVSSFAEADDTLIINASNTKLLQDSLSVVTDDSVVTVHNHKKLLSKYPPFLDTTTHKPILRNQLAPFGQKVLRGFGLVLAAQSATTGLLFAMPKDASNWDKNMSSNYVRNFKEAFKKPPVVDKDKWYINYLGHPYQGAYYYNAYRSQGAKTWQSFLFSVAHSTAWEYLIESGFERPSIQDLIVTPCVGSLVGELFHFATIRMSRNGFKWYEAAFVSLFNPMFAINNGFKRFNQKNPKVR